MPIDDDYTQMLNCMGMSLKAGMHVTMLQIYTAHTTYPSMTWYLHSQGQLYVSLSIVILYWQASEAQAKCMVNVPIDDDHFQVLHSSGVSWSAGKFAATGWLPLHARHVFVTLFQ